MKNSVKYLFLLIVLIGVWLSSVFLGKTTIHLAYMTDRNYLPYVETSIYSAYKNKKLATFYQVHIIAKDFTAADIKEIKRLEKDKLKINIYPAKPLNLDMSHLGRFASFEISLQKLFISEYLKIDKVLYLDADTLVLDDLSTAYQTDLKNNYVAAVKDGLMYQHPEHIAEIGLAWRGFYFNSGIMLLNLKAIRQDNIIKSALIYFNTHQEIFGDQDVLNVVFKDKVAPLSYRYNCNSTFFEEQSAAFLSKFYEEHVPTPPQKVYETAAILHFAGHKPWTPYFNHSYLKSLWQSYADEMKAKYQRR